MSETQENSVRRVVVACQGGGSLTAFTAGVLEEVLAADGLEVDALSGTSGGAVCAALAWYGLLKGDPAEGIDRLAAFWTDNATHGVWETLSYDAVLLAMRVAGEVAAAEMSPYLTNVDATQPFLELIERHLPFDELRDPLEASAPRLLIGAADVENGQFRVFRSHPTSAAPADRITSRVILASAAVPTLFRAVHLDQRIYWDGLFSQNPPVRELPDVARDRTDGTPPDELWIVQINPIRRVGEPRSIGHIRDRRNELSGNISLQQELYFIGHMNRLALSGALTGSALQKYRPIKVRAIQISDEVELGLDYESKLERNPVFLKELTEHGRRRAREFLAALDLPEADQITPFPGQDIWAQSVTSPA